MVNWISYAAAESLNRRVLARPSPADVMSPISGVSEISRGG